jgi:hypothetical protein
MTADDVDPPNESHGDEVRPEVDSTRYSDDDPAAETAIIARSNVTVDGVMTEARLLELIALGDEEDALDFKLTYDIRQSRDVIECAKVAVCMANSGGGYIVLGVDEVNKPGNRYAVVGCPNDHVSALLDPTDLHNKIERYVEEPLDIRVRVHRHAEFGVFVPLMFVPPTRTLPLTFRIQGEYAVVEPSARQRMITAFRPGEIWGRRGAACIQASARDWRRIRSDMRRAERARWADELLGATPLVQRMDRITVLLERILESGGLQSAGQRSGSGLTSSDYLLPPAELARRLANLLENDES